MHSYTPQKHKGFTLLELLIVLSIASIVTTIAIPSFNSFVANNRLISNTNALVFDINLARSEAIKRGGRVAICKSSNPNASSPSCDGSIANWAEGWLVFSIGDSDNNFNSAADKLIKVGHGSAGQVSIKSNANSVITFRSDGSTLSETPSAFSVCDNRGEKLGKQIQINIVGRTRLISKSIPDCNNPAIL